jgi:uncharacterized protein Smg (DUF494 family)
MEEISPYDNAYPVKLLSNSLKSRFAKAQAASVDIYKAVAKVSPIVAQAQQSLKKGYRFVLDTTENTLEAIDTGKIKLTTDKTGKMFAQIREANGQFGSKIPIKKEHFRKGFDPVQMANMLQMMALQEQIQEIADQINVISYSVREVLQGQQNDRIGLYYSGLSLFLESRTIADSELKKVLISQSLKALSEATYQLSLTMQSNIQYLANKEYESDKKNRRKLMDEHVRNVNQSFAFIHRSTMLRAGIYCEQGELVAMATVLDGYSRFIEESVANNANLLSQCDQSDDGTVRGVWKSRAKLTLDMSDFLSQINMPDKTIYMGIEKENE